MKPADKGPPDSAAKGENSAFGVATVPASPANGQTVNVTLTSAFEAQQLGVVMEPEAGNALEVEGVLNPGAARGPDGQLYLFPRMVGSGNYSRIGIARVIFDHAGDPIGVKRLGTALVPEADYELRENGGGCEDPRVTFVEPLRQYVMTYTALSRQGPRVAIAISEDLFHWRRLGLATFRPDSDISFHSTDDKDASVFPTAIPDPSGHLAIGLLHRPLFPAPRQAETGRSGARYEASGPPGGIWISYCPIDGQSDPYHLGDFTLHRRLAGPVEPWEQFRIGGGTPPILTRHGWLIVYHGVHALTDPGSGRDVFRYSAGVMLLSRERPDLVRYRSASALLAPPPTEPDSSDYVAFPTGIDQRNDLGLPDRLDVYYGMGDRRIGVMRLTVPNIPLLPRG